jgi:hypothetical protein
MHERINIVPHWCEETHDPCLTPFKGAPLYSFENTKAGPLKRKLKSGGAGRRAGALRRFPVDFGRQLPVMVKYVLPLHARSARAFDLLPMQ